MIHTSESNFQISTNLLNFGLAFRSVISVFIWIAHTAIYGHLQYMSERLRPKLKLKATFVGAPIGLLSERATAIALFAFR